MCSHLRVDPEEHCFLVSEAPFTPHEGREALAEVMFETFGVAGLHVGVSTMLALAGAEQLGQHMSASQGGGPGSSGAGGMTVGRARCLGARLGAGLVLTASTHL